MTAFCAAAIVSSGVLRDDTVDIHVYTRDARSVSISVSRTDSPILGMTLPCSLVNVTPMADIADMVRRDAQDAFNARVKNKSERATFADMMRLQTGAEIRHASFICAARNNNV